MISKLFGTDGIMDMMATPTFWYVLVGIVGFIVIFITCIKHPAGGKYVLFSILGIGIAGLTTYSGIQLNYYYSASGGIYGALTGVFQTNEVNIVSQASYEIKNTELTQQGETDTYSADIILTDIFELSQNTPYMIYVNDMPCEYVENASDYIIGKYSYAFYDDSFNELKSDTLTLKFAFYTNSTALSISTNGGSEAVKYWNYYFSKNNFILKLDRNLYSQPDSMSAGSGNISNYCVVTYKVDDIVVANQVYKPNTPLSFYNYSGKTWGWRYNGEPILNGKIVKGNMVITAESQPSHIVRFITNGTEYLTQQVYDSDYVEPVETPATIYDGAGHYMVFDYWTIDGQTEYNLYSHPIVNDTEIIAKYHNEYVVEFIVDNEIYESQIVVEGQGCTVVKNPKTTYDIITGYKIFTNWTLNGEVTNTVLTPIASYTRYVANFRSEVVAIFMFNNEEYAKKNIINSDYVTDLANPTSVYSNGVTTIFDGWSIDGENIIDLSTYRLLENTTFIAVTHKLYDITVWYHSLDELGYTFGTVKQGSIGEIFEIPSQDHFVVSYYSIGSADGERLSSNSFTVEGVTNVYVCGDYIYNVKFTVGEGLTTTTQVLYRHNPEMSTIPEKANCDFQGWSLDGSNIVDLSTYRVDSDVEFVAIFTDTQHTLTLDYNDGNESEIWTLQGIYGETINLPTPISSTGDSFVKWVQLDTFGTLDNENMTYTFGSGDGNLFALYDVCEVSIFGTNVNFDVTYNDTTTEYRMSTYGNSSSGTSTAVYRMETVGGYLSCSYSGSVQINIVTGSSLSVKDVYCDGSYEISRVNKTTYIVTWTDCNYVNIGLSVSNAVLL